MIPKVRQNLKNLIQTNDTVIFGISGGIDSMSLLNSLLKIQKETTFQLILAHINHQLRGQESDQDEHFITDIATQHNLELFIHRQNIAAMPGSLETNGRKVRYEFFQKLQKDHQAKWIITAHHANDSLETVIMNIARGTSTRGLCGISLQRDHFLRPLYNVARTEIETYAQTEKILHREDQSNQDTTYKRNFIRHEIIPKLKELNPQLEKTFLENQNYWQNLHHHHQETAKNWLQENQTAKYTFPIKKYLLLPEAVQTDILSHIYSQIHGSTQNLNTAHLAQIQKILHQDKGNTKKEFGPNHWLEKKSPQIRIFQSP